MKDILQQHVEYVLDGTTVGRVQRVLQSRLGLWIVAAISFFESALPVPLITDPFMIAAIMADRSRTWVVVCVTTVSSLFGGLAAFAMAAYFFDIISARFMTPSIALQFENLLQFGASDTFVTTFTGAITPVPYTITAWVIAVAGGSVFTFILASILGRSVRYGIVGYCTYRFGPLAIHYIRRYIAALSLLVLFLVVIYILLKM